MTTTETPTAQAPPVPPHIVAMNATTQAVRDLHRWLRNVLIVFLIVNAIGGFIAYKAVQDAGSSTTSYCISTDTVTCP